MARKYFFDGWLLILGVPTLHYMRPNRPTSWYNYGGYIPPPSKKPLVPSVRLLESQFAGEKPHIKLEGKLITLKKLHPRVSNFTSDERLQQRSQFAADTTQTSSIPIFQERWILPFDPRLYLRTWCLGVTPVRVTLHCIFLSSKCNARKINCATAWCSTTRYTS